MAYTCPSCGVNYAAKPITVEDCATCNPSTEACDQCGVACAESGCGSWLCVVHQHYCLECGEVVCEDHMTACVLCGVTYCDDCSDDAIGCMLCAGDGCKTCLKACAICEQPYCATCMRKCACGNEMCRNHSLLLPFNPTAHCQNCIDHMTPAPQIVACEQAIVANVDDSAMGYFNPPLELFKYSQASKQPKPDNIHTWQAEHPIPNSCFLVNPGRTGATVAHSGIYSEGRALCFWIEDAQSNGHEHRWITDYENGFSHYCFGRVEFPTVEHWFQYMENGWKEMLLGFRDYTGPQGANATETDNLRQAYAAKAAHALRAKLQVHYFKTLKVDQAKCRTKILLHQNQTAPPTNPAANQQFNGF